jgi:hypothetical protein
MRVRTRERVSLGIALVGLVGGYARRRGRDRCQTKVEMAGL